MVSTRSATKRQMPEAERPLETPKTIQGCTPENEEEIPQSETSVQRSESHVLLPPQHNLIDDLKSSYWTNRLSKYIFEKNITNPGCAGMRMARSRLLREGAVREPDFKTLETSVVEKRLQNVSWWKYYQAILVQMMGELMEGDDRCLDCQSGTLGPFATCVAMKSVRFGCCANCIWRGHASGVRTCKHYSKPKMRIALEICANNMH